jgi:hypothetical protein
MPTQGLSRQKFLPERIGADARKMTGRKTLVFSVALTCCFISKYCAGAASRRVFLQYDYWR